MDLHALLVNGFMAGLLRCRLLYGMKMRQNCVRNAPTVLVSVIELLAPSPDDGVKFTHGVPAFGERRPIVPAKVRSTPPPATPPYARRCS